MNIKQLGEIHRFYTHFLAKIRHIQTSRFYRNKSEEDKKSELSDWLTHHKSNKTFGESVRHEIFHMLEMVPAHTLSILELKISNLEQNCERICCELEERNLTTRISIRKSTSFYLPDNL
ncbi:MAG: hypothetical protein PW844_17595 [Pantoea sp.]|uniref:hypothetical protein n=1 Tax=Pantoea sp. TaxID=69393 RepID=UPI0023979D08|nr:hypothetical protein [Pantoea sp.]MDE1188281.1 hypothetical protein [Pantoea sp.]